MEATERFDEQLSRVELIAGDAGTWDLSEKDIAALRAVLKDRERLKAARVHTQEWYAVRWERLEDWARKEIPDELSNQFFSIVANGTKEWTEAPAYATLLNEIKYRAERAEAALKMARKEALEEAASFMDRECHPGYAGDIRALIDQPKEER